MGARGSVYVLEADFQCTRVQAIQRHRAISSYAVRASLRTVALRHGEPMLLTRA